ncbi:pyranose oxidase [Serendipita vermifera]|nr:pyranose oxidase [Serendipita vermifera]
MSGCHTAISEKFEESSWENKSARIVHGSYALPALPMPPTAPEPCDVFIAGSGPVGATYARLLVAAGYNVVMCDVGDEDSPKRGSHKKNNIIYQKDINKFGALQKVSVPTKVSVVNTLSPSTWKPNRPVIQHGNNPKQNPFRNLPAQAVTRVVGGMATHWTCAVPRFHPEELPKLHEDDAANQREWYGAPNENPPYRGLYDIAESFVSKGDTQFEGSIRHNLVLSTLKKAYPDRKFQQIPLACTMSGNFPEWQSAHEIFPMDDRKADGQRQDRFTLLPATICKRVVLKEGSESEIDHAIVENLRDRTYYKIQAKVFILAAGAICNPQILVASGFAPFDADTSIQSEFDIRKLFKIQNLGRFITEQTMAFCQTVFHRELVDSLTAGLNIKGTPGVDLKVETRGDMDDKALKKIKEHILNRQDDPIPIPLDDLEPQVTTLFSKEFPWHTQRTRTRLNVVSSSYGAIAESIDTRLIVDWRFFGRTQPEKTNRLIFSNQYTDSYGMPQPTFDYGLDANGQTAAEATKMMTDMVNMASKIGGYLPGSEPQFMEPGLALHLGGSHRSGLTPEDSVVDVNSKVWEFSNLFLGGVGNIPTAFASNPTLTAIGYAIKSCEYIKKNFQPSPIV